MIEHLMASSLKAMKLILNITFKSFSKFVGGSFLFNHNEAIQNASSLRKNSIASKFQYVLYYSVHYYNLSQRHHIICFSYFGLSVSSDFLLSHRVKPRSTEVHPRLGCLLI